MIFFRSREGGRWKYVADTDCRGEPGKKYRCFPGRKGAQMMKTVYEQSGFPG